MSSGTKTPLIIAAVVVIAGATAAYFLLGDSPDSGPNEGSDLAIQSPSKGTGTTSGSPDLKKDEKPYVEPPPPSRPTPAPPPVSTLPKQERPGAKARRIISKMRSGELAADMDYVVAEATGFQEHGEGTDSHLLLFYAARNGHTGAMFALATAYDPLHFKKGESAMDEPTPDQAHKWYLKSANAGNKEAVKRLSALKAWVAEAAAKGDRDAQQLLERW